MSSFIAYIARYICYTSWATSRLLTLAYMFRHKNLNYIERNLKEHATVTAAVSSKREKFNHNSPSVFQRMSHQRNI